MMHLKSFNQPPKGTTLIETLIFTAIGSILLLSASSVYFSGLQSNALIDAQQHLFYVENFVYSTLQLEITSSNNILTPISGTENSLVFYNAKRGGNVSISLDGTNLLLDVGVEGPVILNSMDVRVNKFNVTRLQGSPHVVRVEVGYEVDSIRNSVIQYNDTYTFTLKYE